LSSSFKREKKNGGIEALTKRAKTPGTVDVGIIDAGMHSSGDMTVAAIGFVHEYGGTINHPGGTPYKIVEGGRAVFLKKGDTTATGVTEPHDIVIPERSFLRSTMHAEKKNLMALQKKLLSKITLGEMDTKTALGLVGEFLADKIKSKIINLKSPPNTSETVKRKGSSNPLVATGQLANSITYEVNV